MWLAPLLQLVALSAVVDATPGAPGDSSIGQPPIYTRQTRFSIPFQVARPDSISREPAEVQLFVSGNRGARWDFYWKTEPTRGYFLFNAGGDGEYWFQVRTLDRSGQLHPAAATAPEMKVIVDTTPPKVQLQAQRGDAGQIIARVQIDEPYPKGDSLLLQYRLGPTAAWQRVAIGATDIRSAASVHSGEVTWWPPATSGTMEIRLEISDMAGNPAVSTAQVILDATRTAAMPPANLAGRDPQPAAENPSIRWPAQNQNPNQNLPADQRTQVAMSVDGQRLDPTGGVALRVNPPIRNQFVASETPGSGGARMTTPGGGSEPPIRMVNSRLFRLDYDTQSVGASGISRVELWGTIDRGRTWQSFGTDNDRHSPMDVTVDQDGVYGFRIAIRSGAGLGGAAPQPGDQPEIWIGVDLTRPTGRITSLQQGRGPEADKMTITWEARDNMRLAARPVTLSYGTTIAGPWTVIAQGLENTGRYTWTIDGRVPQQVYVRLEVRDDAGNTMSYETPQPVSVDRGVPTARIRQVRPLGDSYVR